MKKTYLCPEMECEVVGAIFALCDGTVPSNSQYDNQNPGSIPGPPTPTPGSGNAPRRPF